MHRVVVLVRGAIIRCVGGLECALIQVRRDPHAKTVIHRIECASPPLIQREKRLP